MKTKITIGKVLLFCAYAVVGSFLLAETQSLGINIIDLFGGVTSGLIPFVWEYAQGINRRISDAESIVDAKLSSLNGRIEQLFVDLQNCATEDDVGLLQAELYATKAIAHQGTNSASIALDLGRVNQERMNGILSEGSIAKNEYRINNLEIALREFRAIQNAKENSQFHTSEPE